MSGPQGDLAADRIALVLAAEGGRTLERIEGYGAVAVADRGPRRPRARGSRTMASDGRYVLTGTPVRVHRELPRDHRPHVDLLRIGR